MPPDHRSARAHQDAPSSQAIQTIKQEVKSFKAFLVKVSNDYSLTFSSALAFTLLLSTFPTVIALLSIFGFLLGRFDQAVINTVVQGIIHAPPSQLQPTELIKAVNTELQRSSGILGLIALVSSLVFGSQLFVVLETCFSIIYRIRPRPLIRQQVVAIAMFFLFLLLVPLMVFTAKGIKQKEYTIPGAGEVKQFLPLPEGGKLLLLTSSHLYLVGLKATTGG